MSTSAVVARGAAWTIASSMLSRGLALIGTLVLIRFVVPHDYGEVSAATVIVGTINQITTLGVGLYAITKRDASREDLFHATFIHVTLGIVAFLALMVLGKPLSPYFGTPNMYQYVPGLALSALVDRVTVMPERILIRNLKFRRLSMLRTAAELSYPVASVGAAFLGMGGMSIVVGNLARSAIRATGMIASVHRRDWLEFTRIKLAILKEIVKYGFAVTVSGLANFASRRWDNLLVSRFFGPSVMATYNLAYNLADVPAIHVGEQIADVMQASFAHMTTEDRKKSLVSSLGPIGLVTFPLAIGLGVVAPTLSDLFLDQKWAGAGQMLFLLSALSIARPVVGAMSSFLLLERGPRVLILMEWLTLGALLGLIATLGRISPLWTCGAVGVAYVLRALGAIFLVRFVSGISAWTLFSQLIPPLLACIPMAASVLGLREGLARMGIHKPVIVLGLEVLVGGAVFALAAVVVARRSTDQLVQTIRKRRARSGAAVATASSAV